MKSKIIAALSDIRRLLFGFALIVASRMVGEPLTLYVGFGYILFCIPLCILGETWQDRLFALLTAILIVFLISIPLLISILS